MDADRQVDRSVDRQMNRQTDRQMDGHTHTHTVRLTHRQTSQCMPCRSSSSSSARPASPRPRAPSPRPVKSYRRPSLSSHSSSDDINDDDDDDDHSTTRSSAAATSFNRNNGDNVASNRSLSLAYIVFLFAWHAVCLCEVSNCHVGSCITGPIHILAGWCTMPLNQAQVY